MFIYHIAILFLALISIWIMDVILKRVFGRFIDKANYCIVVFVAIIVLLIVPRLMLDKFGWIATYVCCLIFTYILSIGSVMFFIKKTNILEEKFCGTFFLKKLKCDIGLAVSGDNLMNERFEKDIVVQKEKKLPVEKCFGEIFGQAEKSGGKYSMKRSDQIIGLPIISIANGKEVGIVKDLIVDRKTGELVALLVDGSRWYSSVRLLPFPSIVGLGEYATTVEKETDVLDVEGSKALEKILSEGVKIIGSKVLTKYGQLKGRILQFVIDETGKIVVCIIGL